MKYDQDVPKADKRHMKLQIQKVPQVKAGCQPRKTHQPTSLKTAETTCRCVQNN